jgi:UPF0755 protein
MNTIRRRLGWALLFVSLSLGAMALAAWRWLDQPLALRSTPVAVEVTPGMSPRQVAGMCVSSGVDTVDLALYAWFRISGQSRRLRAGNYELTTGTTPRQLLRKLVDGDESLARVRFLEGWTFAQVRRALAKAEGLKPDTSALDPVQLMQALGAEGIPAEGRFFPDTYSYARGSSDLAVLSRAMKAMESHLATAWTQRAPDSPLRTPAELLTLASIVEKETGRPEDRGLVAGVFINRLRLGMPLQTDPSVIYGLGERFDGNLRRRDLAADGPFNTYTRRGLPPTPIALPSLAALTAAAQPAFTKAVYFVARGDGSSEFSESLTEHNRAVDRYQRQSATRP